MQVSRDECSKLMLRKVITQSKIECCNHSNIALSCGRTFKEKVKDKVEIAISYLQCNTVFFQ